MNRFPSSIAVILTVVFALMQIPCTVIGADTEAIDLSLSQAVKTALQNNLNLKLRAEDVAISEGSVQEAESTFDALLSADIGASETNSTPVTIASSTEERNAAWNAAVQKRFSRATLKHRKGAKHPRLRTGIRSHGH